jgi:hypothetical protein
MDINGICESTKNLMVVPLNVISVQINLLTYVRKKQWRICTIQKMYRIERKSSNQTHSPGDDVGTF